jgi:hypothetical protein
MRILGALAVPLLAVGLCSFGCLDLTQNGGGGGDGAEAGPTSTGGDGGAAPSLTGAGCGTEQDTGTQLCQAVSTCPKVVVDSQAMPHCGFRIRGAVADLVCACGTAICPFGTFASCNDAAQLLASQTEQGVCMQLSEGRCLDATPAPSSSTTSTGNPACDHECMKDCGGGEACASVCNCN